MTRRFLNVVALGAFLAGCSHPPAQSKATLLPAALQGDYVSQRRLAVCYEQLGGCPAEGLQRNSVEACAWRATILASRNPNIEMADGDRYLTACVKGDQPTAQRAFTRAAELIHQVYGRSEAVPFQYVASSDNPTTLYPSAEMLRTRVNAALTVAHDPHRLPAFGKPTEDKVGAWRGLLKWRVCDRDLCLTAIAPPWGAGVAIYGVSAHGSEPAAAKFALVTHLSAAALEAPSLGEQLLAISPRTPAQRSKTKVVGATCWGVALDKDRVAISGACLAPCKWFG